MQLYGILWGSNGLCGMRSIGPYGVSVAFYGAVTELCGALLGGYGALWGLSGVLWGSVAELFLHSPLALRTGRMGLWVKR